MERIKKIILLFLSLFMVCGLLFSLSGCQKRYWYRQKLNLFSSRPEQKKIHNTISINIRNYTPSYLSEVFEHSINKFSSYRLSKKGYAAITSDSADFRMTIEVFVDSIHLKGNHFSFEPIWRDNQFRGTSQYFQDFESDVLQISIKFDVTETKHDSTVWNFLNEFYFFNEEGRDLSRSKGIIRYSINKLPNIR